MSKISFIRKKRGYIRAQVSRIANSVDQNIDDQDHLVKLNSLSKIQQFSIDLKKLDDEVSSLMFETSKAENFEESEQFTKELEACTKYSDIIIDIINKLNISIAVGNVSPESNSSQSHSNKLRLPEVPLPEFSNGTGECLQSFFVKFESIVSQHRLSSYEKFMYLKRQLKNEPLLMIDSLDASSQNYESAKELLSDAFENSITQKFNAVSRLSKLHMNSNLYEFVSEMKVLKSRFAELEIDVDTIFQFFVWSGMTTDFQNQLISICNSNKPSMEEIESNIFKAIERYNEIKNSTKVKSTKVNKVDDDSLQGFAASVYQKVGFDSSKRKYFCSLCSDKYSKVSDHLTKDCTVYKLPDDKVKRLRVLGACTRCGYANHDTNGCNFKFNKSCFSCGNFHMSFLCTRKGKSESRVENRKFQRKESSEIGNVNTGVVWTETVLRADSGSESILPTFSCRLAEYKIRCLKDSGCQPHFIREDLADMLGLPVIVPDYSITVNGFNESKTYSTKIVKADIVISNETYAINAICVPEIRTRMNLPGLANIVKVFTKKGYKLADDFLHSGEDSISNIDFVLGTRDPHLLLETQVMFGDGSPSVYSDTRAGILLMGPISVIVNNLNCLPLNERNSECNINPFPIANFDCLVSSVSSSELEIMNIDGTVNESRLMAATREMLDSECQSCLSYDKFDDKTTTEVDQKLVDFVLSDIKRTESGRLLVPLTWRDNLKDLVGQNLNLCRSILMSNLSKLRKTPERLIMMDKVFSDQLEEKIIEKIPDVHEYINTNPDCSILAHMPVFKLDRETTKCRIVFLSNLAERGALSHNQAIIPGPCLNQKITTAMLNMRFGEYLLIFDLRKAFLQLLLNESDSNKLLFLWFENVNDENYSIIAFKNLRLSFGLRCSPTILMLSLYKILCLDSADDEPRIRDVKLLIYSLLYVDNGAYSGSREKVKFAYENLNSIFNPYCFELQQLVTNDETLQKQINLDCNQEDNNVVKLLGLHWNKKSDTICMKPTALDSSAHTKRLVLKTVASVYDTLNIVGPCLNRARLFLHSLQCDQNLQWDDELSPERVKQWKLVCRQFNKIPQIEISRNVGEREDDYELIGFSDASKLIYGTVLYLKNLRTNTISYIGAKNRIVNPKMSTKSIPSLELQALGLAVDVLLEIKDELCGESNVTPIRIVNSSIFTDSMINLHWLNSYHYKLGKMEKHSVFVQNRLETIVNKCKDQRITFHFVSTEVNPADCITRSLSYNQVKKSCYLKGPDFLTSHSVRSEFSVTLPNPATTRKSESAAVNLHTVTEVEHLVPVDKYSSFQKLCRVTANVLTFINKLKLALKDRDSEKYVHLTVYDCASSLYEASVNLIISREQNIHFPEIFSFFESNNKEIPELVSKLNLFLSKGRVLKMKSKFDRWSNNKNFSFPVLLPKQSLLTKLIIEEAHSKFSHCGVYQLLAHLRKKFWIVHFFSVVKKIIKDCVVCKRMNGKTVKINQNAYRDFRMNPPSIPYRYIFIDYLGPFYVMLANRKTKVYLLCITCLWSRSVNIRICPDMSLRSFLRALQVHVLQEGLPERIYSDLGTQLTAGSDLLTKQMSQPAFQDYLNENGIKQFSFKHYFKGNSSLGSTVEICVKLIKRLIYGSIRNSSLKYHDFELIIEQSKNMMNKRPVAFKEALRDESGNSVPAPLTPELLVKGRELLSPNMIPAVDNEEMADPDWLHHAGTHESLKKEFSKVIKCRDNLSAIYEDEFKKTLIAQAIDKKNRYVPVSHNKLTRGDIILLKEDHMKFNNYPLAIVNDIVVNSIDEVTDVHALKGKTGEIVKRHVTSVIPLLSCDDNNLEKDSDLHPSTKIAKLRRSKRIAATSKKVT